MNLQADSGDTIIILSRPLVPTRTTIIDIDAYIASGAVYDVTQSGVNYTHSGDVGTLAEFNEEIISIFVNGVYCHKGTSVVYQTDTIFVLNIDVDAGDEIIILT